MIDGISTTEAAAILNLDADHINLLVDGGPFAPTDAGMTINQVLGCAVVVELVMLDANDAVKIAISAASEAREDGGRVLAVGWRNREPQGCWLTAIPSDLRGPIFLLGVDKMLSELAARLTAFRGEAARPN